MAQVFWGRGIGATGASVGEVCFNTSLTGYQEIMTDPSYAGQIINFTFPHIGNVGANDEDIETITPAARGCVLRADITDPSNWRAVQHLDAWLKSMGLVGIAGVDTRRLTRHIRDAGAPNGAIVHQPDSPINTATLRAAAPATGAAWKAPIWPRKFPAPRPTSGARPRGRWARAYGELQQSAKRHVVAVDFGAKRNILRSLAGLDCKVTVVPASTSAADVLRHKPDGVFLSNGPGDPAATGQYAVPMIQGVLKSGTPTFGICLGHQMLCLALGAKTEKMHHGHRGANHPVKDLATGKVEITSQNHGFVVMESSLPANVEMSHQSLFDGSLEGIRVKDAPVFSVQYHPEASPGPHDSHYLFERFVEMIDGQS